MMLTVPVPASTLLPWWMYTPEWIMLGQITIPWIWMLPPLLSMTTWLMSALSTRLHRDVAPDVARSPLRMRWLLFAVRSSMVPVPPVSMAMGCGVGPATTMSMPVPPVEPTVSSLTLNPAMRMALSENVPATPMLSWALQVDVAGAGLVVFIHRVGGRAGCRAAPPAIVKLVGSAASCLSGLAVRGCPLCRQRQVLFARGFHLTAVAAWAPPRAVIWPWKVVEPSAQATTVPPWPCSVALASICAPLATVVVGVGHAGILFPASRHPAAPRRRRWLRWHRCWRCRPRSGLGRGLEQAAQAVEPLSACAAVDGGLVFARITILPPSARTASRSSDRCGAGCCKHAHGIVPATCPG